MKNVYVMANSFGICFIYIFQTNPSWWIGVFSHVTHSFDVFMIHCVKRGTSTISVDDETKIVIEIL